MSLSVRTTLFNALSGSSDLSAIVSDRIYHEQAEDGAAFPYVIFNKASGVKQRTLKKGAQVRQEVWLVKVVARDESTKQAEEGAEAVDALLDESTFAVTDRTMIDLHHVGDVDYPENDGDQQYRHVGARYAVVLS
jgi:Protein of unknown function (DUF3168)